MSPRTTETGYRVAMVNAESPDLQPEPEKRRSSRGWSVGVLLVAMVILVPARRRNGPH